MEIWVVSSGFLLKWNFNSLYILDFTTPLYNPSGIVEFKSKVENECRCQTQFRISLEIQYSARTNTQNGPSCPRPLYLSLIIILGINCSPPPLLSLPSVSSPIRSATSTPSRTFLPQLRSAGGSPRRDPDPGSCSSRPRSRLPYLPLPSPGRPPLVWRSLIRAGWSGSLPSLEQRLSSPGATGLELIRPAGSCREP